MQSANVIRGKLKQLPGLRSTLYLGIALRQMVQDQWKSPASFDDVFTESEDPWRSGSDRERERFQVTMDVLDAGARKRFINAVEIGCAEGIFTSQLQPRCDRLLALDFSEVALGRARARLASARNVEFKRWDMRNEPLHGTYDLVVAMGVITSLYRPHDVRAVCSKVIAAMKPGGLLLFSDVRQSPVFETAWWGPLILRGGEQIRRYLGARNELQTLHSAATSSHVFALYRRVP